MQTAGCGSGAAITADHSHSPTCGQHFTAPLGMSSISCDVSHRVPLRLPYILLLGGVQITITTLPSGESTLRGCNLRATRWQAQFRRAPLTSTLAPHVQLPGGLQKVASRRRRAELNGLLACFPDGSDDPNHIPIGLLPPNGQRLSCGPVGRASGWIAYSDSVRRARQLQAGVKPNGPRPHNDMTTDRRRRPRQCSSSGRPGSHRWSRGHRRW